MPEAQGPSQLMTAASFFVSWLSSAKLLYSFLLYNKQIMNNLLSGTIKIKAGQKG